MNPNADQLLFLDQPNDSAHICAELNVGELGKKAHTPCVLFGQFVVAGLIQPPQESLPGIFAHGKRTLDR